MSTIDAKDNGYMPIGSDLVVKQLMLPYSGTCGLTASCVTWHVSRGHVMYYD